MPTRLQARAVFVITCTNASQCRVAFEPDGAVHYLRADDMFEVEIVGSEAGRPEITYVPEGLLIGAWAGAETRVWNKEGAELPV